MTESKKLCIMFQVILITWFLLLHIFTARLIYHFQIINYFLILGKCWPGAANNTFSKPN